MLLEILFYGRGGQGGVTAATLLAYAAVKEGLYGQGFPFFGAERRGAPVKAFARISDKPIRRHGMFDDADVLVVLDPGLVRSGYVKKIKVRDGGVVVVNTSDPGSIEPKEFMLMGSASIYAVDATAIALRHKLVVAGWPVVNTSMLGALSKAIGVVGIASIAAAIKEYWPGRIGEANAAAAVDAYNETRLVHRIS